MRSFGAFYGCEPDFEPGDSDEPVGLISFSLDGNSGWLNDFTPLFAKAARQIARDIDPDHAVLEVLADEIDEQLADQLVSWSTAVTSGRSGREILQRVSGDGSFRELGADLRIHADRLRDDLDLFHSQTGPTAWRSRIDLERRARLDSTGILLTAQRIRRVADDVAVRLPGNHLSATIASFDARTSGLADLRNIAEHPDDYVVGRGRLDPHATEPGDVFEWRISEDEVEICARSRRVGAFAVVECSEGLIRCLVAAADHYCPVVTFPVLSDFDFMQKLPSGAWRSSIEPTRAGSSASFARQRDGLAGLRSSCRAPSAPSARASCKSARLVGGSQPS